MDIVRAVSNIEVQHPPEEEFSSADLKWTRFGTIEHNDDVALIPYSRVDSFIFGESSNIECPTRFHIEKGRKRLQGSLKDYKSDEYLEYRMYWCSFGPENHGEGGSILPSRRYRLNTRNRAARPQSMRGCTCHFVVKRLYARPCTALIIYNERRHVNKSGFMCHGPLDRDAIGPGAKRILYICNEIQQQTMSMIYLGIPEENVLEKHIEGIQRYCGSSREVERLASLYVQKMGMVINRSTHELDLNDQASIRMWADRNKKSVLFYQDSSDTEPFILGIQTEWQLQQLVRFGHNSLVATDSTFGIKRLKYPLYTFLVFDSRHHALPVAWIITRSFVKSDVSKWMKALVDRALTVDPQWKVSGFLVDDAAAEIVPARETFSCPVMFSLWRVRRSWLKNVVKKCDNIEVQREIFKRIGKIAYDIWDGADISTSLCEFMQDFIDQDVFMKYFKARWIPKLGMWLDVMRTLPLASKEASGAIEAYHMKLKQKLYDHSHLGSLQRVDWLVHKLTTELHSSYWLDRHSDDNDSFRKVKEEYIASTSWHRASRIPDSAVTLDGEDHIFAKLTSEKEGAVREHTVWNPRSEFAFCDCQWSLQGNICKHVIKVGIFYSRIDDYKPSLSFLSFRDVLMDMYGKPRDDSVALDRYVAWAHQILDRIGRLVDLSGPDDVNTVLSNVPPKWLSKKSRTSAGRPSSAMGLPWDLKSVGKNATRRKKTKKRKRLSGLHDHRQDTRPD